MQLISSIEAQSLNLSKNKTDFSDIKFRQFILKIVMMYGLNTPTESLIAILHEFITEREYTLEQVEDALKLNLRGKFGQIIKVFNSELTPIFLSQVYLEYEKYLELIRLQESHNTQVDYLQKENERIEKQRNVDRENFINDVKNQWINKTLVPQFYHYQTLIDLGFLQANDYEIQRISKELEAEIEAIPNKDWIGFVVPKDAQIKNKAKQKYIENEFNKYKNN